MCGLWPRVGTGSAHLGTACGSVSQMYEIRSSSPDQRWHELHSQGWWLVLRLVFLAKGARCGIHQVEQPREIKLLNTGEHDRNEGPEPSCGCSRKSDVIMSTRGRFAAPL